FEPIRVRGAARFRVGLLADLAWRAYLGPVVIFRPPALDALADRTALAQESRDLVAMEEQDVGGRGDDSYVCQTADDAHREPAEDRLRATVDPVVVDLGQGPD